MKYGQFNEQGAPLAFYADDVNDSVPQDAIEISDVQWQTFIDNPGLRRWDANTGDVVTYTPAIDAARLKNNASRRIDNDAEQTRLQYITPGAGQALVYQRKQLQARECLAAHDAQNPPTLGSYPALDAEINITGADTLAVAQVVADLSDAWGSVADTIEVLRLTAKAAIDAVPDDAADIEAQIAAIEAGIVWPT